LDILIEEGFEYDSSIFPIVHDRYGVPGSSRFPHVIRRGNGKGILEFPLSTISLLGWNVPVAGGGYFRLFPYGFIRWGLRRINRDERQPAIFYLHPWEIDVEQPRLQGGFLSRFRHYVNLDKTEGRFRQLLSDFRFGPVQEVLGALPGGVAL
jgi:polysaccharide deacetylase family protein (PEP-CTERM system associated)